jgi:hypothetical protein
LQHGFEQHHGKTTPKHFLTALSLQGLGKCDFYSGFEIKPQNDLQGFLVNQSHKQLKENSSRPFDVQHHQ